MVFTNTMLYYALIAQLRPTPDTLLAVVLLQAPQVKVLPVGAETIECR